MIASPSRPIHNPLHSPQHLEPGEKAIALRPQACWGLLDGKDCTTSLSLIRVLPFRTA